MGERAAWTQRRGRQLELGQRLLAGQSGPMTVNGQAFNGAMPRMEVNAQTYDVRADGVLLRCEPAKVQWKRRTGRSQTRMDFIRWR